MKFQFLTVSATTLLAVFMCAWPADYLMDVVRFDQLLYRLLQKKKKKKLVVCLYSQSENTMRMVYESKWYKRSLKVQKFVLFMTVPQTPVILRIRCIIPAFSLNYYCSVRG